MAFGPVLIRTSYLWRVWSALRALGSLRINFLRAGFAAGAKNSKQTCLGDQRRPLKRGIRPSSLLREVETAHFERLMLGY